MESADALIGQVLEGRYLVRRLIGRGGMGAVYEAEAIRLARPCAIKVLLPEFTESEAAVQRFRREAQVAARIKHPHVIDVFDTGTTAGGVGFIAMELLAGESLAATLRREGRLPWPRVRHVALQVCEALAAAHAQSVVHRDMKPDNCLRFERGGDPDFIKVLDFGIAKLTDEGARRLTATDAIVGTYAYMAAEQISGRECDPRADVWAVGVMLYEMLTGVLPFGGANPVQIWAAISEGELRPMRARAPDAGIPAMAEEVVRRALARDRDARYASAAVLGAAILAVEDEFMGVRPTAAPSPPRACEASSTRFAVAATLPARAPEPGVDPGDPGARTEAATRGRELVSTRSGPAPSMGWRALTAGGGSVSRASRGSRLVAVLLSCLGAAALVFMVALPGEPGEVDAPAPEPAPPGPSEPPPTLSVLAPGSPPETAPNPAPEDAAAATPGASEASAAAPEGKGETYAGRVEASLARLERRVRAECVGIAGTVTVEFEVRAASGKVLQTNVQGAARVALVSLCVTQQIKAWAFPKSRTDPNYRKTHTFRTR